MFLCSLDLFATKQSLNHYQMKWNIERVKSLNLFVVFLLPYSLQLVLKRHFTCEPDTAAA